MAKKAYIGVGGTYTVLDYIQSNGTQYIDTGFKPNQNTRVVMDIELPAQSAYPKALFGARNSTSAAFILWAISASGFRDDYAGNSYTMSMNPTGRFLIDKNKSQININGTTSSFASSTFQINYPLTLFGQMESAGVDARMLEGKLYSCQIYDNGTLVRDFVPAKEANGAVGLCDRIAGAFYGNKGSGSFTAGTATGETISLSSVARKVKKGYIGIENVARKIKKAYIGIGGVARPCWSGGELAYYGTITALSTNRYDLSATSNGSYALFAGGEVSSQRSNVVDAYNASLTRSKPTALYEERTKLAATSNGTYALFGGGISASSTRGTSTVDAYDAKLTRVVVSNNLEQARFSLAATNINGYALFGGGAYSNTAHSKVESFDTSLSKRTLTALSYARYCLAATTIGNFALFGGGYTSNGYAAAVDAYNTSLTRSTATALSANVGNLAATTVGDYALFGGGDYGSGYTDAVDAYDASLTKITAHWLSGAKSQLTATSIGNYAIFGNGRYANVYSGFEYDIYDASLTRTTMPSTVGTIGKNAATTIGNYALFGGGYREFDATGDMTDDYVTIVDAFTVA